MESRQAKVAVGSAAAALVESGMTVGLGTGSTAAEFVRALAARCGEGLKINAVPTSDITAGLAASLDIPLIDLPAEGVDIAVDGADAVDGNGNLLKGRGGALVREKIVAESAAVFIVIVDMGKLIPQLAGDVALEILPFGLQRTLCAVSALGGAVRLREKQGQPLVSDNGNYLADANFTAIDDPLRLSRALDGIPGIVGHGIFAGMSPRILVGTDTGEVREEQ